MRPKPSKPRYRTVPDPLEEVTARLRASAEAEPGVTGRQLLDRLRPVHAGASPDGLIRTVQRRPKIWRRECARALVLGGNDTVVARGGLADPSGTGRGFDLCGSPFLHGCAVG